MVDWITLGAVIAIIGTIFGVLIPMFVSFRSEVRAEFRNIDEKIDRKNEAIWVELVKINGRLPAEPELAVYQRERRVRQSA